MIALHFNILIKYYINYLYDITIPFLLYIILITRAHIYY